MTLMLFRQVELLGLPKIPSHREADPFSTNKLQLLARGLVALVGSNAYLSSLLFCDSNPVALAWEGLRAGWFESAMPLPVAVFPRAAAETILTLEYL